jgi:pyruvate kinase
VSVRSTKIVATLGPAVDDLIGDLIAAGVDAVRVNFSHGSHDEHARRIRQVRNAASDQGRFVAILADLQGPKIRIKGFAGASSIELTTNANFCIDCDAGDAAGGTDLVGTTYPRLAEEVAPGDVLVLGDGLVELSVDRISGRRIYCRVLTGGELGAGKGINKRGGGLSAPALTDKDRRDIAFACREGVDYIAVSFPRSAEDMIEARRLVEAQGSNCGLLAKLERAESVADPQNLDALILASDAVMVARGDLGIEIGDAALMGKQKQIILRAAQLNRPVVTATQMMESMISNPRPTRAEVMDVANAVVDGTDAVMLSAETAVGRYPLETVQRMVEVIQGAEASAVSARSEPAPYPCKAIDEGVALAAMTVAESLQGVRAVACLTSSGNTPRLMSRARSRLPIYALADNPRTLARVALFRGVHPELFETEHLDYELINEAAVTWLARKGAVRKGDRVILSKGDYRNVQGGTNTLKILEVA